MNTIFGNGVVNTATDQLNIGMFQIAFPGSNLISPQLKFEWTANARTQTIGIFGWNGSAAISAQIFTGSQTPGAYANVAWNSNDDGVISTFDASHHLIVLSHKLIFQI